MDITHLHLDIIRYIIHLLDVSDLSNLRLTCKNQCILVNAELCSIYKRYISTSDYDLLDTIITYSNLPNFFAALPNLQLFTGWNNLIINNSLTLDYKSNPLVFLETYNFSEHDIITHRLVENVDVLSVAHLNIFIKRMIDVFYKSFSFEGATLGKRLAKYGNAEMFAYFYSKPLASLRTISSYKCTSKRFIEIAINNIRSPDSNNSTYKLLEALWLILLSDKERIDLLDVSNTILKEKYRSLTNNGEIMGYENYIDDREVAIADFNQFIGIHLYVCSKFGIYRDDVMLEYPNVKAFLDLHRI